MSSPGRQTPSREESMSPVSQESSFFSKESTPSTSSALAENFDSTTMTEERPCSSSSQPSNVALFDFELLSGCEDVEKVNFENSSQPVEIMKFLDEFRQNMNLCDVEIEVEGETIQAHRFVLAAAIPYFRSMFTGGMLEMNQKRVVINDISAVAMKAVVDFVYTNKISISSENVQQLLFAASILQIDNIVCACQHFLTRTISTRNCLSLRQFAEIYNCEYLLSATDNFVADNFSTLRSRDEFKRIPFTHILSLLQRCDLNVKDETDVFEAVISWVEFDEETRNEHLPEVFETVRLPLLKPQYLCEVVNKHPLIKKSQICRDYISEALFEMLSPLRDSTAAIGTAISDFGSSQYGFNCSISTVPQASSPQTTIQKLKCRPRKSVAGVVFCAGGRGTAGDPFRSVEAYDLRRDVWIAIADMTTQRRHVGVVSACGKLYAIGGHDGVTHLASAEVFDPTRNRWDRISPMQTARRGIAVATLDNVIYAVGGLDDITCFKFVERYDIELDTWSRVADMTIQRGGVGVSSLGKFLFAIGGNDGTSSLESCERFDPLLDRWTAISNMTNRRAGAGVCVLDGLLYAIGGFDDNAPLCSCERYDPKLDQWTLVASLNSPRGGVGVAAMCGHVYAIGGHDGTRYLNTVERFDPVTNSWSSVTDIKECRAGAGVAWSDCRVDQIARPMQDSGCAPSSATSQCI